MRHIRIYEEFYSDEEIKGMLDDLSEVGLADKFKVECNVFIMVPNEKNNPIEWPEWAFRNIEVEVFCQNDEKIILEKAFEKVLIGQFDQESNTYLDQMFKSAPELTEILSKEHMIRLAKKVNNEVLYHRHESGNLYALQENLLIPGIKNLMYKRIKDSDRDRFEKYLKENIQYNIRITKI